MSGIKGQRSDKPVGLSERYERNFLTRLDGRGKVARELQARMSAMMTDLGGEDNLSYSQKSLVERGVYLEALIQGREQALAVGEPVNLSHHIYTVNALIGIYKTLGLRRISKDGGSLHELLKRSDDE